MLSVYLVNRGQQFGTWRHTLEHHLNFSTEINRLEPCVTLQHHLNSSPLPGEVPLLHATVGDGVAVRLVLHVHVDPGNRRIQYCHWTAACINLRVLLFFVRLYHSHPVVELLLGIHLAVRTSHGAGPPHLGMRSQVKGFSLYQIITDRFFPQQNVKMSVVGSAGEAKFPVDGVHETQHVPENARFVLLLFVR